MEADRNIVSTEFGNVSDRRLQYRAKKRWFSGGVQEDIPLRHVTSVTLEISRHPFWGVLLVIVGVGLLVSGTAAGIIFGLLLLGWAALLLWGSPTVTVNTAGTGPRQSTAFPWKKSEGEKFTQALRNELFRNEDARTEAAPRWG
jgi:hypothetical protein